MKRRLVKLVLFLLLGAIVNVAVAWACVHFPGQLHSDPVKSWTPMHDSLPEDSDKEQLADLGSQRLSSATLHLDVMTAGGLSLRVVTEDTGKYNITAFEETSAGWPCLSMRGLRFNGATPSARQGGESTWVFRAAIPRPEVRNNMGLFNKQLPLRPIWPGFAINTLFYAAILWLLFAAPGLVRRHRRIKRGLCPACAYPVGASATCTECGRLLS